MIWDQKTQVAGIFFPVILFILNQVYRGQNVINTKLHWSFWEKEYSSHKANSTYACLNQARQQVGKFFEDSKVEKGRKMNCGIREYSTEHWPNNHSDTPTNSKKGKDQRSCFISRDFIKGRLCNTTCSVWWTCEKSCPNGHWGRWRQPKPNKRDWRKKEASY